MARRRSFSLLLLFVLSGNSLFYTAGAKDEISKRVLESPGDFPQRLLHFADEEVDGSVTMDKPQFKSRRQRLPMFDPSKIDIVFIIDRQSKFGQKGFKLRKQFVQKVVGYLPIFPARTRVACVTLAARVKIEFNFKKYINKECTRKGIQNIRYTRSKSSLSGALYLVQEELVFNKESGARFEAQKIVVVVGDRKQNRVNKALVNQLKRRGVEIVFIGIKKPVKTLEEADSVGRPQNVFYLESRSTLHQLVKLLGGDSSRLCRSGELVNDVCGRRCKCVDGKLTHCCRVRTQFTEMSVAERQRYIAVVKTASTHPTYKEKYERLLTIHKTIFNTGIHQPVYFLPWHRWFVLEYENLLREIDCSITVPYWESAEEANDALASEVWNAGTHGFGGNGTGTSNCVQDGPFRAEEWSVIASAGGGCLQRNFNGRFPDCLAVREALLQFSNLSSFDDFEKFLHREFHDAVHCVIGGHMCTDNSASSPEFFLHHGYVDKLWFDWQKQSTEHTKNEHFTSQTTRMPSNKYFSKDLLDLRDQPGCVCVDYRDPSDEIYTTVNTFSKEQVREIPRVPLPSYPERARKLFHVSDEDMERLRRIRDILQPVKTLREDALDSEDRVLGFRKKDLMIVQARGLLSSGMSKGSKEAIL